VARKFSPTTVQEELYPVSGFRDDESREGYVSPRDTSERERFGATRLLDLEAEQESPFLRGQKRVPARRGSLPKSTATGLRWGALALLILVALGLFASSLYGYGKHSWRFRIDSSDQIEVLGGPHVTRAQIMDVMGGDIGRNIFFVPLAERQGQLQQIPWVESASVMRFVPNRLRIEIHERTPVAFARIGSHISLIDAGGNLMELPSGPKHRYSFPVITGMNANEPLVSRTLRMKDYNELIRQLDSGGARYAQDISEVDLTDGDDVRVMTADSAGGVLVHLGNTNYLQRYKIYMTHVEAWRQQFDKLDSVDLRYDGQIIVNPDLEGIAHQPALTPAAAKAAIAAGVKNAAIVNYEKLVKPPAPPALAGKLAQPNAKPGSKAVARAGVKRASKTAAHRAAAKPRAKVLAAKKSVPSHPAASQPAKTQPAEVKPAHPPAATNTPNQASPAPMPVATVAGTQKKPSAAIPKENPQN